MPRFGTGAGIGSGRLDGKTGYGSSSVRSTNEEAQKLDVQQYRQALKISGGATVEELLILLIYHQDQQYKAQQAMIDGLKKLTATVDNLFREIRAERAQSGR